MVQVKMPMTSKQMTKIHNQVMNQGSSSKKPASSPKSKRK